MPARGYAEAPRPCGLCPPSRRRCPRSPPKPATAPRRPPSRRSGTFLHAAPAPSLTPLRHPPSRCFGALPHAALAPSLTPLRRSFRLLRPAPLPGGPPHQAPGTAPAQRAGPAVLPEGSGDLQCGLAGAFGDVIPAVAKCYLAGRGAGVVAPDIRPAETLRVRLAPVQLDYQGMVVVAEVLVLASPTPPDRVLPTRRRQAVRPFHPADVPELEQGLGPVFCRA